SIFGARAADRGRELAIRLAIGSSHWHILRQLLLEAICLSIIGGICGLLLSSWLLHFLSNWNPMPEFPVHVIVIPDVSVYGLALLLSIGSGLLFGLLPARQVWQTSEAQVIKTGTTGKLIFCRLTSRDLLLGV